VQSTKDIYGHKLAALDGDIGHVKDFYFDDETWVIRYLVADTGSWLPGRLVLLSPYAFGALDQDAKTLHVKLQKLQIENSPSIDSHRPVSRQWEVEYYGYYGWPSYWEGDSMWGLGGYPAALPPTKEEVEVRRQYRRFPGRRQKLGDLRLGCRGRALVLRQEDSDLAPQGQEDQLRGIESVCRP
jgi:hypothetical protein